MLLAYVIRSTGLVSLVSGRKRDSRQRLTSPSPECCRLRQFKAATSPILPTGYNCRRSQTVGAFAPDGIGEHGGGWDADELGRALQVPPPAARALARALQEVGRLPQGVTAQDVGKRCRILQQDLGLNSTQVARMLSLQPKLLSCPTATLRACAVQLAAGLSSNAAVPAAAARSGRASSAPAMQPRPQSYGPAGGGSQSSRTNQPTAAAEMPSPRVRSPDPRLLQPVPRRVRQEDLQETTMAGPTAGDNMDAAPQARHAPAQRRAGSDGGGGSSKVPGSDTSAAVSAAEAIAIIARQPALLGLSLERLCALCHEMARLLGTTPYEACMCLTRLRPHELEQVLQAPLPKMRNVWRGLVAALASLEQLQNGPGQQMQHSPVVATSATGMPSDDGDDGGGPGERQEQVQQQQRQGQQQQHVGQFGQVARPQPAFRPNLSPISTRGPECAVQRMVLLCPQLLFMPPDGVRASARHLGALLRLPFPRLRHLLVRSPRLLLLPPRHRIQTMRALTAELGLRDPHHAARL
ncbi:hypothetical protein Agub_g2061, partial [Astrephomene gubernaculifera]